jgi:hypothetical protein
MQSKRKPGSQTKSRLERNGRAVFYDFYRLLSRGEIDSTDLAQHIKETRLVWHVDTKGEWRLTPDSSRGAFTVKKALSKLARMTPHFKLGTSVWDPSGPPEPEEWLEPRGVYGYPGRELHRLDLLRPNHSARSQHNKSRRKAARPFPGTPNPNQKNLIFPIAGALLLLALDGNQRLTEEFSGARSHSRWRKRIIDMIQQETGLKGGTNRIVGALRMAVDNFLDSRLPITKTSKKNSKDKTLQAWYDELAEFEATSKATTARR